MLKSFACRVQSDYGSEWLQYVERWIMARIRRVDAESLLIVTACCVFVCLCFTALYVTGCGGKNRVYGAVKRVADFDVDELSDSGCGFEMQPINN